MRERNCCDISTKVENSEIQISLKENRKISFIYCPVVDRIFSKSNFDLDKVNFNDFGITGRPNMFGEMEEIGEIGQIFSDWIQKGWKCYRYDFLTIKLKNQHFRKNLNWQKNQN